MTFERFAIKSLDFGFRRNDEEDKPLFPPVTPAKAGVSSLAIN
jgi:hypothetical protein